MNFTTREYENMRHNPNHNPAQMQALVSIIVPCYRQAQFLADALESVKNQTCPNWECIIVNDGSPDNCEEIAKQWCKDDNRFKYIYKHHSGVADARNIGIETSKGEYILPLDADDKIATTYLEKGIRILSDNQDVKIVYAEAEYFGELQGRWKIPEFDFKKMLTLNLIHNSSFFRRKDFDQTTGYNPNMEHGLEDWDFWLSLLETGGNVYRIRERLFFYRVKKHSRVLDITPEQSNQLITQIYQNHQALYLKHLENPLILTCKLESVIEKNQALLNSLPYKTGMALLFPYYKLRSLIN